MEEMYRIIKINSSFVDWCYGIKKSHKLNKTSLDYEDVLLCLQ